VGQAAFASSSAEVWFYFEDAIGDWRDPHQRAELSLMPNRDRPCKALKDAQISLAYKLYVLKIVLSGDHDKAQCPRAEWPLKAHRQQLEAAAASSRNKW